MRYKLEGLEKLGKFEIKLVERAGSKVVDILYQSNAWNMMDCERNDCIICNTETSKKGSCRCRNVLYETFCITCQKEKEERERKYDADTVISLEGANQVSENKNPIVVEVNDTPVLVETKEKRNHTDTVISLGGANQVNENKNPVIVNNIGDVMENEVNDTPVTVETKNEVMKARKCSVVQIPKGKISLSLKFKERSPKANSS